MFSDLVDMMEHKRDYCKLRFTCKCDTLNEENDGSPCTDCSTATSSSLSSSTVATTVSTNHTGNNTNNWNFLAPFFVWCHHVFRLGGGRKVHLKKWLQNCALFRQTHMLLFPIDEHIVWILTWKNLNWLFCVLAQTREFSCHAGGIDIETSRL